MEVKRKPYQGVLNILRFNWHFYAIAILLFIICIITLPLTPLSHRKYIIILLSAVNISIIISLIVSYFIYDISDIYKLKWSKYTENKKVLIIHAGFDEITDTYKSLFPSSIIKSVDFYNPEKNTEISIKRARKLYPPPEDTIILESNQLPFKDTEFDTIVAMFSIHEIRVEEERTAFLKEIHRSLQNNGQVIITEHLRDLQNFIAYNIGFYHFHSKSSWIRTFKKSGFKIESEVKTTPFISTFRLSKHGNTH